MDVRESITDAYAVFMKSPCNEAFERPDPINIVEFPSPRRNGVITKVDEHGVRYIVSTPRPVVYAKATRSGRSSTNHRITCILEAGIVIGAVETDNDHADWLWFAYHPYSDYQKWQRIESLIKRLWAEYRERVNLDQYQRKTVSRVSRLCNGGIAER
jgi:hypothetical protein